ncbi:hypothetical protein [Falsiroseomonas tokyonensis]|uniref:DUF454 family protein n=1 Tax=Falsiroseomonas tokyonensis TaxID=430521 RepID=A0ABV7C2I1_9PROT|nr:hypothetical protein [Falsiroseomonas tokyonensis]MBU8540506.1 hypothetical protein [Falsiroseomonas tokyonensis]
MMEYRPSFRRKCAGWSLIAISPLGGLLPILPGVVFFALGLFILRHQYFWAHRGLAWADSRWPQTVAKVEVMETRMILRADSTMQRLRGGYRRIFRR